MPRYQILDAILHEVEKTIPADFRSVASLRRLLAVAGRTAPFPTNLPKHPIVVSAVNDERQRFTRFIRTADPERFRLEAPLPFRRVLKTTEHERFHDCFVRTWGRWYGGYVEGDHVPSYVTLHDAAMDAPNAYESLRRLIIDHGVTRLLELREWGEGYELDVTTASFAYNTAEGVWTAGAMDWMVYASHESSITFGGDWLVDAMKLSLPSFDRYIYRGWDLSAYSLEE